MSNLSDILGYDNLSNIKYNDFIKIITNRDTIKQTNNFMNGIDLHNKSKYFLSIFLIKYFPKETFEFESDIKSELVELSDKLIQNYYNNNLNLDKEKFKNFTVIFEIWKKQDNIQLNKLLNNTLNSINESKQKIINNRTVDNRTVDFNNVELEFIKYYSKQEKNIINKIKMLNKF